MFHCQIVNRHMFMASVTSCSKGKGYVIPTTSTGRLCPFRVIQEPTRTLTRLSQRYLDEGEKETDVPPRFPSFLVEDWASRKNLENQKDGFNALTCLRHSVPVILCNTSLVVPTAMEALIETCGDDVYDVWISEIRKSRCISCDQGKNMYGTGYFVREPETQVQKMSVEEFRSACRSWHQWSLMMKIPAKPPQFPDCTAQDKGIRFEWLKSYMQLNRWTDLLDIQAHMACINLLLPAQYKTHDSLVSVVTGRLRVLLINPKYAFDGLYPFPKHHPYDRYTMVDFDNPDDSCWPEFRNVNGLCCVLKPNEVLYIPQYWFAHIHILEDTTEWFTFDLRSETKLRSDDCIPLQVSRYVEDYSVMLEGIQHSRKWLMRIAQATQLQYIDLGTVSGYRRVELVQRIRDEIEYNVESDVFTFLTKLCNERLLPTSWLNKDFREPLYLKDNPIIIEDERTEEQINYPEFFQHVLQHR